MSERDALRRKADQAIRRWETQLSDALTSMFDRQEAVVLARLRGTKARKGTRHWDPPGERKIDESYTLQLARWVLDGVEVATKVLERIMVGSYRDVLRVLTGGTDPMADLTADERAEYVDPGSQDDDAILASLRGRMQRRLDAVAEGITTAANEVQQVIADGEEQGKPLDEIADDVQRTYAKRKPVWVQRMVTVNVVGTANEAALAGAVDAGAEWKQWLSAHDDRVRPTHRHADGDVVPITAPFELGGIPEHPEMSSLEFPGDPTGPADEVINCRCTLLFPVTRPMQYAPGMIGFQGPTEEKRLRHVRSEAGARRFHKPIGALIVEDQIGSARALGRRAAAGGFTYDPRAHRYPKHGYVVAVPGHSHITPKAKWDDGVLDNYVEQNWDDLQANKDLYLGGWLDKQHDEVVLDLVEVLPDRDEAIRRGQSRNEQAIFDLDTFEEISTGGTGGREELLTKADGAPVVVIRPQDGESREAFTERLLTALREAGVLDETKRLRHVRTPEGARQYHLPIGSVIGSHWVDHSADDLDVVPVEDEWDEFDWDREIRQMLGTAGQPGDPEVEQRRRAQRDQHRLERAKVIVAASPGGVQDHAAALMAELGDENDVVTPDEAALLVRLAVAPPEQRGALQHDLARAHREKVAVDTFGGGPADAQKFGMLPEEHDAHEVAYAFDDEYRHRFDAWHKETFGEDYKPPSKPVAKYRSYGGSSLWVYADGTGSATFTGKAGKAENALLSPEEVKALLAKGAFKPQSKKPTYGHGTFVPTPPHISAKKHGPPLVPPTDVAGLPGVRWTDERSPGGPKITLDDAQLAKAFDLVGIKVGGPKVTVHLRDQQNSGEQGVTWHSGPGQYEVVVKVLPGAWPEPEASLYVVNNSLLHELRHVHQSEVDPVSPEHFNADYSHENATVGYGKNKYELEARLFGHLADPTGTKPVPDGMAHIGKDAWVLGAAT